MQVTGKNILKRKAYFCFPVNTAGNELFNITEKYSNVFSLSQISGCWNSVISIPAIASV